MYYTLSEILRTKTKTPGNSYPLEILCQCWFQLTPGNCTCYFFNKPALPQPRNPIQPPLVVFFLELPNSTDRPFHLPEGINWSSCTNFLTLLIMFAKYKSRMQMVNYWTCPAASRAVWYTHCIVIRIVHYYN